jgi:hypothetical protein
MVCPKLAHLCVGPLALSDERIFVRRGPRDPLPAHFVEIRGFSWAAPLAGRKSYAAGYGSQDEDPDEASSDHPPPALAVLVVESRSALRALAPTRLPHRHHDDEYLEAIWRVER